MQQIAKGQPQLQQIAAMKLQQIAIYATNLVTENIKCNKLQITETTLPHNTHKKNKW